MFRVHYIVHVCANYYQIYVSQYAGDNTWYVHEVHDILKNLKKIHGSIIIAGNYLL